MKQPIFGYQAFALVALIMLLSCTPAPLRQRSALLCTASDGRGFGAILDLAANYATYSPRGGTMTSILKLEKRGTAYVLRDGGGPVVVLDLTSNTATVPPDRASEAGTFTCRPDPSPPEAIPEPGRR